MLTKAHQLDVVAKEFDYCFKTVKLESGNLRGEFYKSSNGTPNVMLVLYNFRNVNNLNLEKHFKFPDQLQKVLRSLPEIKRNIQAKLLKKDAIEQAENLVKIWNMVKNLWIKRYLKGNRRILRDWIKLQNDHGNNRMQKDCAPNESIAERNYEVLNEESDEHYGNYNEARSKEAASGNNWVLINGKYDNDGYYKISSRNLAKRTTITDSDNAEIFDKKQRLEEQPENNLTTDVFEKLKKSTPHSEANKKQKAVVHYSGNGGESDRMSTATASLEGSIYTQDVSRYAEKDSEGSKKAALNNESGKIVNIWKMPSVPKPEPLHKALQIKAIAIENGYVFDIAWGEGYNPRAEFYRLDGHPAKPKTKGEEKGKETRRRRFTQGNNRPDAMLVFENLLTLEKSYKFLLRRGKHRMLHASDAEFQSRVQSNAVPCYILRKAKNLDEAWDLIMEIWRKRQSSDGLVISEAREQSNRNDLPEQMNYGQIRNKVTMDTSSNDEAFKVCILPKVISPFPPTPEAKVDALEEEESLNITPLYSLSTMANTETNTVYD